MCCCLPVKTGSGAGCCRSGDRVTVHLAVRGVTTPHVDVVGASIAFPRGRRVPQTSGDKHKELSERPLDHPSPPELQSGLAYTCPTGHSTQTPAMK